MRAFISIIVTLLILTFGLQVHAQEMVVPLKSNVLLMHDHQHQTDYLGKKTRASLPFIDDFSYQGPYPNPLLWEDKQAYVNNTMSDNQITRGMATLDGLNKYGRPHYPNQFSSGLADSLTSVSIDLSTFTTASNVYLSFYYQPQGLGFSPELDDSLFLYFKNNSNQWVRMWQQWGTPWQPFKIQLIAVADPQFLHNNFQFRFVNIASLNLNNDTWNLDYIKLDANRSPSDSIMNDVAMTLEPSSILAPYSAMPYRHFVANQANEKSALQTIQVRNITPSIQNVSTFHKATELLSATPISNLSLPSSNIGPASALIQSVPTYNISYSAPTPTSKVIVRNEYYINSISANDRKDNDTIVRDAIFDNYFAYDDGSAEKAYFLYSAFNYPAKTALAFTLNEPDTIRGISVFFGAQAPTAAGKYFSIVLYKQLAGSGLQDSIIQQEDLYRVQYDTLLNGFTTYAFSNPIAVPSGSYYIGITQPANFGSDSIYYGLDVNNNTSSQHLYYNVDGSWYASSITGSVMLRPMVGQYFTPTQIGAVLPKESIVSIYPNPVNDIVHIQTTDAIASGKLFDMYGHTLQQIFKNQNKISVRDLVPGIYFLEMKTINGYQTTLKFIKQH